MSNRKNAHGHPCPYCARPMNLHDNMLQPTRDHVMPVSKGGRSTIICCLQCNGMKADMLPEQWAGFMEANPRWWLLTRLERRAILRGPRAAAREAKWGPRRQRQGTPPARPVVVPPELVYANTLRPYELALFLLNADREAKAARDADAEAHV